MAAQPQKPEAGESDSCKYCDFIKAHSCCHNRITEDIFRELLSKEAAANQQLCQAQAREVQLVANIERVGLENQNGRRQVNYLNTQLNSLRNDYSRMETQNARQAMEISEMGSKHQQSEETLRLMLQSLTYVAKGLSSLSPIIDKIDQAQHNISIDDLILQNDSEMPAFMLLCNAVRQTILQGNANLEATKQRMYSEIDKRELIIKAKDTRIGELLESSSNGNRRRKSNSRVRARQASRSAQDTNEQCRNGAGSEVGIAIKEES